MDSDEMVRGERVTESQITEWAAEADADPDVAALKRRGRGRPGRGAEPSQVVAVRMTPDELAALDVLAEQQHQPRSEVIREAIAAYSV